MKKEDLIQGAAHVAMRMSARPSERAIQVFCLFVMLLMVALVLLSKLK